MKLWLSPYQLKAKSGGERRGYILKTQMTGQEAGYADIFPWPEFGDPDFSEIPTCIQQGQASPLIKRSLYFSRRDALERSAGQSLIRKRTLKNHCLVFGSPETWQEQVEKAQDSGFYTVKIKVGRDPEKEIPALLELTKISLEKKWLRLDFNDQGNTEYFEKIRDLQEIVQFVEDPSSDLKVWKTKGWDWAYDHSQLSPKEAPHLFKVVKPAKQNWEDIEDHPLIFTSYLDHPVGIAHAMVEALEAGVQLYDYGLMSHNFYESTPFHEYLQSAGPHLTIAGDKGIGFDDLFDDLEWVEI